MQFWSLREEGLAMKRGEKRGRLKRKTQGEIRQVSKGKGAKKGPLMRRS